MKIHGVIILRIADLKKFCDFGTLWRNRMQLIATVNENYVTFFDTTEERVLFSVVRNWFKGRVSAGIRIERNMLLVGMDSFPLGEELAKICASLDGKLPQYTRLGLIALLKLLGVGEKHGWKDFDLSECLVVLRPEWEDFSGDYIPRTTDCTLPYSDELLFPLSKKIIVNHAAHDIAVRAGTEIRLKEGECVVGLFHDDVCCRLLPCSGANKSVGQLRIVFDQSMRRTDLRIRNQRGERTIPDVVSFHIEEEGYAYVTGDGHVEAASLNDLLYMNLPEWNKHRVLELFKNVNGHYHIITTTEKL